MSTQRDTLRAAIANASTFQEQVAAVTTLDEYDRHQRTAAANARSTDWADTVVRQTLAPAVAHERSTIETDWLGEFTADASPQAHHAAMAEAAMWFGRTSAEVRADAEEFAIQAEGFMRREASKHGDRMDAVLAEGLSYLGFLWRQAASGLDQIQQTVNPHEDPKPTPLPTEVFDNFAEEVHPINSGVVGTETSERAPLLQEIESEGGGQGQPEVPGGHSTTNEPTGPAAPYQNTVADSGNLGYATSVAINHQYTMEDFLKAQAASGLDQVQQVVDPHEDPKPTALPTEVQFPWLIGPDAYGNGGGQQKDVEHSASRHPFGGEASQKEAGHPSWDRIYDRMDQQRADQINSGVDRTGKGPSYNPGAVASLPLNGSISDPVYYYNEGYEHGRSGQPNMGYGGRDKALAYGHGYQHGTLDSGKVESSRKVVADMFGNSDTVHPTMQPDIANTPATTPGVNPGFAEGRADALAGDAPTVADASSAAPPNAPQYAQGYEQGFVERKSSPAKDFPVSMGGDNGQAADSSSAAMSGASTTAARRSDAFVKAASREDGDFRKGYGFATKWAPGKPLVSLGSARFEAGLYAGLVDRPEHVEAWRAAHRRQARKDESFGRRIATMDSYTDHLAEHGIDVTAATTTDLDTMAPSVSPSPTGQTPINGPGTVPPLAGGVDPARPGGPSPYNGAQPLGAPAVPTGPQVPQPGSDLINDVPGGPADGNTKAFAFRRQVQAALVAQNQRRAAQKG